MAKILLNLDGLDCAGCAAKIEDRVNKLEEVKEANLNFTTKSLVIVGHNDNNSKDIVLKAKEIINRLEPDVIVSEKNYSKKRIEKISSKKLCKANKTVLRVQNKGEEYKGKIIIKKGILNQLDKRYLIRFSLGLVLFVIGMFIDFKTPIEFLIFFLSYLLVGGEIVLIAIKNILKGEVFDENFLMTIATIGAFAIKEYPEAVAVMIFYQVGEIFQSIAVNRSRKSIEDLMDIRPDYANLKLGDKEKKVSPDRVKVGDYIIVKPGEKIPLDGIVVNGQSFLDTSALTGETILREISKNDDVLAGCINKNGVLTIKVTKDFGESTVSKILELVENAGNKKAKTEKFITKFARYYTPAVVLSAVALAVIPPMILGYGTFSQWLNRSLVFLVVSCPCALVVSIPLGFFGGIGAASKNGILVKGGNYLEALKYVDTVVVDKTGTLTKGVFKVHNIKTFSNISKEDMLKYAAYGESYSNHPIAKSILEEYGKIIDKTLIKNYNEIPGQGVKVEIDNKTILVGNRKLMYSFNINYTESDEIGTLVYLAVNDVFCGYIVISDEVKSDSNNAITTLKNMGIKKIIMLTGDSKKVADKVKNDLGLDKAYSELLPNDKVEKLEEIFNKETGNGKVMFIGDGINDAPVLARADIGVAMGGVGSDAAIEAADIVIMNDQLSKIPSAIKIAKKTSIIVWENIIFALSIKLVILVFGAMGLATMWEAVFGDVGVALIAVLNSMRTLKIKE